MEQNRVRFNFIAAVKRYVLVNGAPEPFRQRWGGLEIFIPARDEVIEKNPSALDRFHSVQKPDGSYIPGTLLVWDLTTTNELGGIDKTWDCEASVRSMLGIRETSPGEFTYSSDPSDLGLRGVSVAPPDVTPEEVESIKKSANRRWKEFSIALALQRVTNHDNRNEKRRRLNLPEIPPAPSYMEAVEIVSHVAAEQREKIAHKYGLKQQR